MNKESQYEFIPEVWDNIMSYRKKPIEAKLWKMGIKPLVSLLKDYTRTRFTNMNSSKIPLEERKTLLIKCLMEYHINKGNIVQLYGAKLIREDWESKRNQTYGYDVYSWEEASQHVRPVPGRWPKISVSPDSLTLVDNYLIQKSFDYGR
mgnify:CR=1 FL=1